MNSTTNLPGEVHDWYIQPKLKDFSFNPFFLYWNFEFFILISKDFRSKHSPFTTSLVRGKENRRSWMNTVLSELSFYDNCFHHYQNFCSNISKRTNFKNLQIINAFNYTFIQKCILHLLNTNDTPVSILGHCYLLKIFSNSVKTMIITSSIVQRLYYGNKYLVVKFYLGHKWIANGSTNRKKS